MPKKLVVVDLTDESSGRLNSESTTQASVSHPDSRVICVDELDLSSLKADIPIVDLESIELPIKPSIRKRLKTNKLANEDLMITQCIVSPSKRTEAEPQRNPHFLIYFSIISYCIQTKMRYLLIRS
jgi:hypothetical protein